jgi:hypothetical protein
MVDVFRQTLAKEGLLGFYKVGLNPHSSACSARQLSLSHSLLMDQ